MTKEEPFTEFSGSSKEDQACAKLFWQSLTLHPPIESRLVSGDVHQRLPKAGPGKQRKLVNITVQYTNVKTLNLQLKLLVLKSLLGFKVSPTYTLAYVYA